MRLVRTTTTKSKTVSTTGAIKQDKIVRTDDDRNIKVDVTIRIDITTEIKGWWLYPKVTHKGETIYEDMIFTDGKGCYSRLPGPGHSSYSMDISKHIQSMFTVWLEDLNHG